MYNKNIEVNKKKNQINNKTKIFNYLPADLRKTKKKVLAIKRASYFSHKFLTSADIP